MDLLVKVKAGTVNDIKKNHWQIKFSLHVNGTTKMVRMVTLLCLLLNITARPESPCPVYVVHANILPQHRQTDSMKQETAEKS